MAYPHEDMQRAEGAHTEAAPIIVIRYRITSYVALIAAIIAGSLSTFLLVAPLLAAAKTALPAVPTSAGAAGAAVSPWALFLSLDMQTQVQVALPVGLVLLTVLTGLMAHGYAGLACRRMSLGAGISAIALASVSLMGSGLVVWEQSGRRAHTKDVAEASVEDVAKRRAKLTQKLAEAEEILAVHQKKMADECASGKKTKCDGRSYTVDTWVASVKGYKTEIKELPILVPDAKLTQARKAAKILHFSTDTTTELVSLLDPMALPVWLEWGAIICAILAFTPEYVEARQRWLRRRGQRGRSPASFPLPATVVPPPVSPLSRLIGRTSPVLVPPMPSSPIVASGHAPSSGHSPSSTTSQGDITSHTSATSFPSLPALPELPSLPTFPATKVSAGIPAITVLPVFPEVTPLMPAPSHASRISSIATSATEEVLEKPAAVKDALVQALTMNEAPTSAPRAPITPVRRQRLPRENRGNRENLSPVRVIEDEKRVIEVLEKRGGMVGSQDELRHLLGGVSAAEMSRMLQNCPNVVRLRIDNKKATMTQAYWKTHYAARWASK